MTSGLSAQRASVMTRPLQARSMRLAPAGRQTRQVTRALSDTNLIISGSTAALLALGRFVFLPYHRSQLARAGLPTQNGVSHADAGDRCVPGIKPTPLSTSGAWLIISVLGGASGRRLDNPLFVVVGTGTTVDLLEGPCI